MLRHILAAACNPALMTDELQRTVCEHAAGNRRVLMNLCNEMLVLAVAKNAAFAHSGDGSSGYRQDLPRSGRAGDGTVSAGGALLLDRDLGAWAIA